MSQQAERPDEQPERTSQETSPVVSFVLFAVIFIAFIAGLYIMSLFTVHPAYFLVGLGIDMVALFATFTVVPKYLT